MSWQMAAVGLYMRATSKRRFAREAGGAELLDRAKGDSAPPSSLAQKLVVTSEERHGFEVYVVRRMTRRPRRRWCSTCTAAPT